MFILMQKQFSPFVKWALVIFLDGNVEPQFEQDKVENNWNLFLEYPKTLSTTVSSLNFQGMFLGCLNESTQASCF